MGKSDETKVMLRYGIVVLLLVIVAGGAIAVSIFKIVFVDRDKWLAIEERERNRVSEMIINPERGNIYASDGSLMATSFPLYHIYLDFRAKDVDSLAFCQIPPKKIKKGKEIPPTAEDIENAKRNGVDSLSYYLARKLNRDERKLKEELKRAFYSKSARFKLTNTRISYLDLKEIQQYPFFRLGANKSGRISEVFIERNKPYMSLASRTVGEVYVRLDSLGRSRGRAGLELQYDSLLRGIPGLKTRERIGGRWMDSELIKAVNGMDIRTTIDLDIQYIAEKSLRNMMVNTNAQTGTVVVMEVKTGEVKAIANLGKDTSGIYKELDIYAVTDMIEPGSTFKTASIMVALEDGVCQPTDMFDTGSGSYKYYDRFINDHNKDKGGNGIISVEEAMYRSSNIGVAKVILRGYENNPRKYVEGLYRLGIAEDLHVEMPRVGSPKIRMPNAGNWYPTALPWMSFGYETLIPPIYMLTFYNAIANNGKMIRPFFVKEIVNDGKTYKRFGTEVVRESICSPTTLKLIRSMLIGVVEDEHGTGKPVRSNIVRIAGKTGTAKIGENGRYEGNGVQTSFAGYFPADAPEYSCIAVIRRPKVGDTSGGGTAGRVVKEIAESIYTAYHPSDLRKMDVEQTASLLPPSKSGNKQSLRKVLKTLDIDTEKDVTKTNWVAAAKNNNDGIRLEEINIADGTVPRVIGMGAKDGVYLLERAGLRVKINGTGSIVSQSIQSGQRTIKGQTISLVLK